MTAPDATADAPRRLLLRNRNFLWLWGGDAISQLGTQFTQLAIPVIAVTLLHATEYQVERWWREARLQRLAPVSQEMTCNFIAQQVLGMPRSY